MKAAARGEATKTGLSFWATSLVAGVGPGRLELRLGIGRSISHRQAAASGVIAAFECCAPSGSVLALTSMAVTPTIIALRSTVSSCRTNSSKQVR